MTQRDPYAGADDDQINKLYIATLEISGDRKVQDSELPEIESMPRQMKIDAIVAITELAEQLTNISMGKTT